MGLTLPPSFQERLRLAVLMFCFTILVAPVLVWISRSSLSPLLMKVIGIGGALGAAVVAAVVAEWIAGPSAEGQSGQSEAAWSAEHGIPPGRTPDALAALGRDIGLTNKDFEVFDRVRDKTPAEPLRMASVTGKARCASQAGPV